MFCVALALSVAVSGQSWEAKDHVRKAVKAPVTYNGDN